LKEKRKYFILSSKGEKEKGDARIYPQRQPARRGGGESNKEEEGKGDRRGRLPLKEGYRHYVSPHPGEGRKCDPKFGVPEKRNGRRRRGGRRRIGSCNPPPAMGEEEEGAFFSLNIGGRGKGGGGEKNQEGGRSDQTMEP